MLANEGKVLRYLAKMIPQTDVAINSTRSFVIRYYLADDTVDVFEPPVRGSSWSFTANQRSIGGPSGWPKSR